LQVYQIIFPSASPYNNVIGGIVTQDEFKEYYKMIGLKVAYYRKLKGLTQEQLAEIMGVGTSFLGQIEAVNINKAISLDTLFRISKALEIPPHKLLDFT